MVVFALSGNCRIVSETLLNVTLLLKGALSSLRQFSETKIPLKTMKNVLLHLKSSFCSPDI